MPVILATGYAELERGAGGDVTKLAKPFTQAELGRELEASESRRKNQGQVLQFRQGAMS
jgi:beta-mannanase